MKFKDQLIDGKLLFSCVALGKGKVQAVDFLRQLRHLGALIMQPILQPPSVAGA